MDFVEQLWIRMRKSQSGCLCCQNWGCLSNGQKEPFFSHFLSTAGVTSYQDIGDCLKLVIDALRYGDIKPWVISNVALKKNNC